MSVDARIIADNFVYLSGTEVTATSEDASFPASNIKNFTRAKVWRSAGFFEIRSTNNKIDFKESGGGAELTATIPVGDYSVSGLEAQVKASMEVAGANTYTVSFNTASGFWSISTSGGFLSLLAGTGSNIANGAWGTLGWAASDRTGATAYTADEIALHTKERVIVDISTTEPIDSVAVVFDPLVGFNLTAGGVMKVLANATNEWSSPAVSQTLTYDGDNDVATHFFTSDQDYRYWAIEFTDPGNPDLFVQCGKIVLGKKISFTRQPQEGFTFMLTDQSKTEKTPYGHRYVDVYPALKTLEFNLAVMPDTDFDLWLTAFQQNGAGRPIAIALDSQELLFDKESLFFYGYVQNEFKVKHIKRDLFDATIKIEEAL